MTPTPLDRLAPPIPQADLDRLSDRPVFLSLSGGKDSTAAGLLLREHGVKFQPVFADTGWEHPDTYAYVDSLEKHFGPIARVGYQGGMRQLIRDRGSIPAGHRRFCTEELKMFPLAVFFSENAGGPTAFKVVVTGIRRAESRKRAVMDQWEVDDVHVPARLAGGEALNCYQLLYRPLLDWKLDDVVEIHRRHGVAPNPLYLRGFTRVGCFPCVLSGKDEIRRVAAEAPEIIDEIEELEQEITEAAATRFGDERLRTFFQKGNSAEDLRSGPIRQVVQWARNARGGRQGTLGLDDPNDDGGCGVWGLCEHGDEGWEV